MENQRVIRTFVAVGLDEELRSGISAVAERVKKLAPNVKWVAPGNLHVTLKFLGNVREDRIAGIGAALDEVAREIVAFDLSVSGLGVFPNPRKPRVVWVGIEEGRDQLVALAGAVEDRLARAGFEKESKPFKTHITIGRVKEGRPVGDLTDGLAGIDADKIGAQRVDSVIVMESMLKPEGPEYTPLSVHKLMV
jgi:2'-5' RNA ligase